MLRDHIQSVSCAQEVKGYHALMELHDINPDKLLGDKGYDSDDIRDDLAERGIEPVIPPRSNRSRRSASPPVTSKISG
jgi:IS5 family transposase